jgi:hypothetical protein
MEWLMFSYWLSPEPSRKRVSVWRQLKKIGALSTEGAGWLLPNTDQFSKNFSELARNVEEMGGTANLYLVNHFTEEQEQRTIVKFQQEREKEYSELIAECHKALKHIEWEYDRKEFNFEEVEELEGDVEKIKRWLAEISKRDTFQSIVRNEVENILNKVEESLANFIEKTYEVTEKSKSENDHT